jgi:hypothetical protein
MYANGIGEFIRQGGEQMIYVRLAEWQDFHSIRVQRWQLSEIAEIDWQSACDSNNTISVCRTSDDKVLAIAGVYHHWRNRAEVFALVSEEAGPHMVALHRLAKPAIASIDAHRVEASTMVGFDQARRWLLMLGFMPECTAHAYGPDGSAYIKWVRFNDV